MTSLEHQLSVAKDENGLLRQQLDFEAKQKAFIEQRLKEEKTQAVVQLGSPHVSEAAQEPKP